LSRALSGTEAGAILGSVTADTGLCHFFPAVRDKGGCIFRQAKKFKDLEHRHGWHGGCKSKI
jgi:hypothetical protein